MFTFLYLILFLCSCEPKEKEVSPPIKPIPSDVQVLVEKIKEVEVNGRPCDLMRIQINEYNYWYEYMRFVDCRDDDIINTQHRAYWKPYPLQ